MGMCAAFGKHSVHLCWLKGGLPESYHHMKTAPGISICVSFRKGGSITQGLKTQTLESMWLSSLRLTSIESVMPSSHLILCRPLLLLPPIPPSIRVFSNESTLHMRWPKYWSVSFIPSKEISGLISFRMDWLDLIAVQGTLKSLLQLIFDFLA